MAIPYYPYLLLKMLGPNGVLSFWGDLRRSYDCDMEAVQIVAKAQQAHEAQEIANLTQQTKPEDMETPTKKEGIITPPFDSDIIKIDLGTSGPTKTALIGAHLPKE
jgi:capsular polysaccharide biosynthesis protein